MGGVPEKALPAQAVLFCSATGRDLSRRHRQQEPPRDHAGREVPRPALPRALHRHRARLERRRSRGRGHPHRHAGRLRAPRPASSRATGSPARRSTTARPARCCSRSRGRCTDRATAARPSTSSSRCRRSSTCAARSRRRRCCSPTSRSSSTSMLATDTPDMADRGDVALGGGPAMSIYSFHGRGTLNGVDPAPRPGDAVRGRRRGRGPAAPAQRPGRRADRPLLRADWSARAWPRSTSASPCATPTPRWRSATSATSSG